MKTGLTLVGVAGLLCLSAGCVGSAQYERADQEAMQARLQSEKDQDALHALAERDKQLRQRLEDLEARVQDTTERSTRTDRERIEARDELLKYKMDRESQVHRVRERLKASQKQLERERAALDMDAAVREKLGAQTEETRKRLQELLQEVQGLLDQLNDASRN